MSARAAWRLESLGFPPAHRYTAGKQDWLASDLPFEGDPGPLARDAVRRDVPTCRLDDRLADVRPRVRGSGFSTCVVLNDEGVVLGRVNRRALESDEDAPVEQAMREGPGTYRPSVPLAEVAEWMAAKDAGSVLVTTSDGRLVGLLLREDVERVLASSA